MRRILVSLALATTMLGAALEAKSNPILIEFETTNTYQKQTAYIDFYTCSWNSCQDLIKSQPWWNNRDYLYQGSGRTRGLMWGVIVDDGGTGLQDGKKYAKSDLSVGKYFGDSYTEDKTATNGPVYRVFGSTVVPQPICPDGACNSIEDQSKSIDQNISWAAIIGTVITPGQNVQGGNGFNKTSNLSPKSTLFPVFNGGTLTVDQASVSQNFAVDDSTTNAIDASGQEVTFSGVLSDVAAATPGNLRLLSSTSPASAVITFSGANTYSGTTSIESGELSITGSINSATTVFPGATLSGTGTIKASVVNGGTVAPGGRGASGILTIDGGNYTQTSLGTLDLDVGGNGASDLLQINNGRVTDLAGTVRIASLAGTSVTPGVVYTGIKTAPGLPTQVVARLSLAPVLL